MLDNSNDQSLLEYLRNTASKFLDRETTGGFLLMAATASALLLVNLGFQHTYHHYLTDKLLIRFGAHFQFGLSIEKWINDGLMVIFFLVAGLELKREVIAGELSTRDKATMPLFAALGGMVIPALIFVLLNMGTEGARGWGIPMATDIAYSLGVIGLLGRRISSEIKAFLIALAIADDLGAILIIAFFYSEDLNWINIGLGTGVFALMIILNRRGVKRLYWYIITGIMLWYLLLHSGIHPTIAGVLIALTIPAKPGLDSRVLKQRTDERLRRLEKTNLMQEDPLHDVEQRKILRAIKRDTERSRPPLLRMENRLSSFNAYFIIPVFAFANAGVILDVPFRDVMLSKLGLGILLGLIVGKALGITIFAYLSEKLGFTRLPVNMKWRQVIGLGFIAGIGFTMSLFITNLAFDADFLIKYSKISILIASLVAGLIGSVILYRN